MRNPLPVGAQFSVATQRLYVTFDERIASAHTNATQIDIDGTPVTTYGNSGTGHVIGRRVWWNCHGTPGEPVPPPRVAYDAAPSRIIGVGGGHVAAFLGLPLVLL